MIVFQNQKNSCDLDKPFNTGIQQSVFVLLILSTMVINFCHFLQNDSFQVLMVSLFDLDSNRMAFKLQFTKVDLNSLYEVPMFSFLKSFFGLSFFQLFHFSIHFMLRHPIPNSQGGASLWYRISQACRMISRTLNPRQSFEEFSEDGGDGNASNLKIHFSLRKTLWFFRSTKKYRGHQKDTQNSNLNSNQKGLGWFIEKIMNMTITMHLINKYSKWERSCILAGTQMSPSERNYLVWQNPLKKLWIWVIPRWNLILNLQKLRSI